MTSKAWPFYSDACVREISEYLKRGGTLSDYRANRLFGLGPKEDGKVWQFERAVESKFNVKHAVACNSGTAALHMALNGVGVAGGEVITSPYTFSATAAAILHAGATPVFADIDPHTLCITKETVKKHVKKGKTKAILHVNLFGYLPDLEPLISTGIPVIEDACQSVGAIRGKRYAGTIGVAGAYSFNGSKNVPAGEGGCLVTNCDRIADRARRLANHGENYGDTAVGYNYRMHSLVAILAMDGLRNLFDRNKERRTLAGAFESELFGLPLAKLENENVFYVYPFRMNQRLSLSDCKDVVVDMVGAGIRASSGYVTPPINEYKAFKFSDTPNARELSNGRLMLISEFVPGCTIKKARFVGKTLSNILQRYV